MLGYSEAAKVSSFRSRDWTQGSIDGHCHAALGCSWKAANPADENRILLVHL
jgi:hypothetical protein